MRSQRWKHVGECVAVVVPGVLRELSGLGVEASEIRRQGEYAFAGAQLVQRGKEARPGLLGVDLGGRRTITKVECRGTEQHTMFDRGISQFTWLAHARTRSPD